MLRNMYGVSMPSNVDLMNCFFLLVRALGEDGPLALTMTSGLYHCIALTILSVVWSAERLKEYYPTEYKYILADLDRCRTGNGTTKSIKHKHYNIISSALHTTQADFF